jgi:hypothetical protein
METQNELNDILSFVGAWSLFFYFSAEEIAALNSKTLWVKFQNLQPFGTSIIPSEMSEHVDSLLSSGLYWSSRWGMRKCLMPAVQALLGLNENDEVIGELDV